jgi:hypothetical protein
LAKIKHSWRVVRGSSPDIRGGIVIRVAGKG